MSHLPRLTACLFALLLALGAVDPGMGAVPEEAAGPPPAPSDADLAARIDRHVRPLVERGDLWGTLLVARGERTIYEKSFGMASVELGVPNTSETRFCIASITKPLTQIAAIALINQGKLAAADRIARWLPDFPRAGDISVIDLLRHRAGLPHRVTTDAEEIVPRTAEEMVRFASRHALLFEPGERSEYSSAGYAVLARILEIASGRTYEDLLEEIVFKPAGATHSLHPHGRRPIPGRAQSYMRGPDGPIGAPIRDLSFLVGAGSVYSTPRDLHRIMRGLVQGAYGEAPRAGIVREEGLRWNGITNGYRAFADYHKDRDLYAIFTGNIFTGAGDLLRRDLPKIAAGEVLAPPDLPEVKPATVSAPAQARLSGTYRLRPGSDEPLHFETPSFAWLGEWVLYPTGEDSFYSPQDYSHVKAVRKESGEVEALQWGEPGSGPRFPRVAP